MDSIKYFKEGGSNTDRGSKIGVYYCRYITA